MKRLTISERYYLKEEREILAYISRHRPVSVFDIELCCHMEKKPVLGHLVNLRRQGKVTCLRGKWQIARTAKRDQQLRVVYQHTQDTRKARQRQRYQFVRQNACMKRSADPNSLFYDGRLAHHAASR